MYDQEEALRTGGNSTNVPGNITKGYEAKIASAGLPMDANSLRPVFTGDQYMAIYDAVDRAIAAQHKNIYEIVDKAIDAHKIPQVAGPVAYPAIRPNSFAEALQHLKAGRHVARLGWNGTGMYLGICEGGGFRDGFRTQDFIYMKTADDVIVPWVASQTDIFANDWGLVD